MNEAKARAEHIDPALKAAGWGVVEGTASCGNTTSRRAASKDAADVAPAKAYAEKMQMKGRGGKGWRVLYRFVTQFASFSRIIPLRAVTFKIGSCEKTL